MLSSCAMLVERVGLNAFTTGFRSTAPEHILARLQKFAALRPQPNAVITGSAHMVLDTFVSARNSLSRRVFHFYHRVYLLLLRSLNKRIVESL